MNDSPRFGGRARVGLAVLAVLMVGLAGCAGASGTANVDDGLTPGDASASNVQTTEVAETTGTPTTEETTGEAATSAAGTTSTGATTASTTTTGTDVAGTESRDSDGDGTDGDAGTGASNSVDSSDGAGGDSGAESETPTGTPKATETEAPQTDDGALPEIPGHVDSTFDVAHSRTIASNDDGTTTVEGYVVSTIEGYSTEDLVMVVEVYDHDGNWIGSKWVEIGAVIRDERTSFSVTFDVPREAIGSYAVDANRMVRHEDDEHHQYAGQCPEIEGDGPNDQEAEGSAVEIVEGEGATVVVGEVFNGVNREMAFVRVVVSVYDGDGDRLATKTVLLEDVPGGDRQTFAVPFDGAGVADARVDADEVGISDGGLACRPPL